MPVYEYVCDECGYTFERIQSFNAEPEHECPQCTGAVRRVISRVGVIFKGSGWYVTDSRRQIAAAAKSSLASSSDGKHGATAEGAAETAANGQDKAGQDKSAAKAKPAGQGASAKEPDPS